MKIYLLRHGETDWSKEGRLQGHTDIPLNNNGINQIEAVGNYFVNSGVKIDVIISSPLIRAFKSAEIIAERTGYPKDYIIVEPGFIERSFGAGEGLTQEEHKVKFAGQYDTTAESIEDLCVRADITVKKYINQFFGKTLLIAGHGSILKAVLTSVSNGKYSFNTGEFCLVEYDGTNLCLTTL
ncbi:MAG: histidine phosphatase family protein [Clostridiales bacterium]|nr:histidine phosphatase family protein [Clostridiales bacterium]